MVESASGEPSVVTHYVVEHFEAELSDWTLSEYVHMVLGLNKLYDTVEQAPSHKEVLVITNFPFIAKLKRGELEEDDLGSKRNAQKFWSIIEKPCFAKSVMVSERAFQELTTANSQASGSGEAG